MHPSTSQNLCGQQSGSPVSQAYKPYYQTKLACHTPVPFFLCGAGCGAILAFQAHVPCWDSVAPPQLPADAPVPDVLQPTADRGLSAMMSEQWVSAQGFKQDSLHHTVVRLFCCSKSLQGCATIRLLTGCRVIYFLACKRSGGFPSSCHHLAGEVVSSQ